MSIHNCSFKNSSNRITRANHLKSIQEGIEKSRYSQKIKVVKNKFRFAPEIMKQFFKQTTDSIIAHVKDILVKNKRQGGDIATILRSLINSGLCPYIAAPLRTAATASLGQITLS
jgi:hypothetical protein